MPTQAGCWEEAGRKLRAGNLGSGEASSVGDNLSTVEVISLSSLMATGFLPGPGRRDGVVGIAVFKVL